MKFTERIRWSITLWLFLLFLTASLAWAVWAAFDTKWAIATFATEFLLLLFPYFSTSLTINVSDDWLHVGNAKIEISFLEKIEVLDAKQMALARGRALDPAAYLALRFWVSSGVKIFLNDPKDPTPYWLISTREGAAIANALSLTTNS